MKSRHPLALTSFLLGLTLLANFCLCAPEQSLARVRPDWLIDTSSYKARIIQDSSAGDVVLTNGLIERRFKVAPNAATVGFENLMTGEAMLRGVKPEAEVEIDGRSFAIGGLIGQDEYAYLLPKMGWQDLKPVS